jgi:hypothetical protein
MSSWNTLGPTGQSYIWTEEYKNLSGYPAAVLFGGLGAEVPGTSRINIFQNQIYSEIIPSTAPNDLTAYTTYNTTLNLIQYPYNGYIIPGDVFLPPTTSGGSPTLITLPGGLTPTAQQSQANSYIIKYTNVPLAPAGTNTKAENDNTKDISVTWWFEGAEPEYNTGSNGASTQVTNNILNNGIPPNYDPNGSYGVSLTIYFAIPPPTGITSLPLPIGNETMPWTWNTNSGIIMFTGVNYYNGNNNNCVPQQNDVLVFTFWRYEGTLGSGGGGDTIWQVSTNPDTITPISTYQTYTITGTQFKSTSDYRIKTDIHDLDSKLHNVDNLRPVIYKQVQNNNVNIGLIAHELQEYFPFLVDGEKDGEKTQAVNYIGLIGVLIKEIQDLKKRVNTLESEKIIEELEEMK